MPETTMTEPDVVAELAHFLEHISPTALDVVWPKGFEAMQRARDEIVALRKMVERQKFVLSKGHAETRAAALEEAARECINQQRDDELLIDYNDACDDCAAAIRALKEKPHA